MAIKIHQTFTFPIVIFIFHSVSGLTQISDIQTDASFIWFPNPDESGSFFPTCLTQPDIPEDPNVLSSIATANKEESIRFYHYTRDDPEKVYEIILNSKGVSLPTNFKPHAPVKILIHGFLASSKTPFPDKVRSAYLQVDHDINIIVVDWSILARKRTAFHKIENIQSYYKVVHNIVHVGHKIAKLITLLVNENVAELNKIHIIGHELGAHTATVIAESLSIGKIGRVTALNPSRSGFKPKGFMKKYRLNPGVAQFVDAIHTNDGTRDKGGFSLHAPVGHADFYPNGGVEQPGCDGILISSAKCRQGRSRFYWKESIISKIGFQACKCESWVEYDNGECFCTVPEKVLMGENCPITARGKYYLRTNGEAPFARPVGHGHIEQETDEENLKIQDEKFAG